ncbi:peptidoglycan editing factor PgeF [bacterium]|nr:peptidoglycan editing factor PgeF [bacterium]
MIKTRVKSLPVWLFENLQRYDRICHFVSSRIGGVSAAPYDYLNLGFHVGDHCDKVIENRRILVSTFGIPLKNLTISKQIHGNKVAIVTEEMRGMGGLEYEKAIDTADAMVTNISNICIMVLVADCLPILFFDPKKNVIGAAHAGWRGAKKFVAQNTAEALIKKFDCSSEDIIVGIGPSIGPCCYEVNKEFVARFEQIFGKKEGVICYFKGGKYFLNLWEINKRQLTEIGIPKKNIEVAEICTYCHADQFFSYRHQKGETGRFGAAIMINK